MALRIPAIVHDVEASSSPWFVPPRHLGLGSREVHLWYAASPWFHKEMAVLSSLLSESERARSTRFHFARHRHQFVVAHGLLRLILSRYVVAKADELVFSSAPGGKPRLINPGAAKNIRFSLSHSHELIVCAVSRDREVGIDVEYRRRDFAVAEIAKGIFSPGEFGALYPFASEEIRRAFFRRWCRMEAYAKGQGSGLTLPLSESDLAIIRGAGVASETNPSRWTLCDLPVGGEYSAAVAVQGEDWALSYWAAEGLPCGRPSSFAEPAGASPGTR